MNSTMPLYLAITTFAKEVALEEQMINEKNSSSYSSKRSEKKEIKMFIINALCALHKPTDRPFLASFVHSLPSPASDQDVAKHFGRA